MALTPSVVVMVPMDLLRTVMQKQPNLVSSFAQRVAGRVREMTQQRTFLGLPNIAQRVCCQLWELIPIGERKPEQPTTIINPPTHQEIAIMLNVSRETLTRVFQALQNRGIVKREGSSRLLVNDLPQLKKYAEGAEEL